MPNTCEAKNQSGPTMNGFSQRFSAGVEGLRPPLFRIFESKAAIGQREKGHRQDKVLQSLLAIQPHRGHLLGRMTLPRVRPGDYLPNVIGKIVEQHKTNHQWNQSSVKNCEEPNPEIPARSGLAMETSGEKLRFHARVAFAAGRGQILGS